jgi:flagellar basal-body rod protein FlgG
MGLSTVMQTAASGLSAATAMVEASANNLANNQTPGFKAIGVELATLQPAGGVQVVGYDVDFSQGQIRSSDKLPLLALEGEGFFILEGRDGERVYTRNGQFRLNADGELVTAHGERVLGFGVDGDGKLDRSRLVPMGIFQGATEGQSSYSISRNGRIVGHYRDGRSRVLGQLRLARFANPDGLAARAGNKFASTASAGMPIESDPGAGSAGQVISGATELSNVDIGGELVELTLAGNMFQANLAVLQTADSMLDTLFFPWRVR